MAIVQGKQLPACIGRKRLNGGQNLLSTDTEQRRLGEDEVTPFERSDSEGSQTPAVGIRNPESRNLFTLFFSDCRITACFQELF